MVEASAVDLIRFADQQTSVIVRVLGRLHPGILAYHDDLRMEISVCSGFARGQLEAPLSRRHLDEWEQALSALEAGQNIQWMNDGRNPEIQVEPADDAPCVDVLVTDPVEFLVLYTSHGLPARRLAHGPPRPPRVGSADLAQRSRGNLLRGADLANLILALSHHKRPKKYRPG